MIGRVLMATVVACLGLASSTFAHEIRPAYLQIDATSPGSYDVLWKVPSRGGTVLNIQPQFDPAFAGALSRIGLPQTEIPLALASFNIGVELGQIAFVAAVFLGFIILKRALDVQRDWPSAARRITAYGIGAVSAFWLIDRLWGFAA
jgi:HupE / UreJ protein